MTDTDGRDCPNEPPCPHGALLHDGDGPWPACGAAGCRCAHPGTATLYRADDGTVTVADADPVIRVAAQLAADPELAWFARDDHGQVITLDTAGAYRYRYLRTEPSGDLIYGRLP